MSSPALGPLGPLNFSVSTLVSSRGLGKRERTRLQLIETAVHALAVHGVDGVSVQEIAAMAGVANGTFYNHFRTKEDLLHAVATLLAESLCERIKASCVSVPEGAERMAIGNRRYVLLAVENPAWAAVLMQLAGAIAEMQAISSRYALADLELGIRQGSFRVPSRQAGLDLVLGTIGQAMRTAALGKVPRGYDAMVATAVLRGLGMPFDEAAAVARRPLPLLPDPVPGSMPAPSAARRRSRPGEPGSPPAGSVR